MKMSSLGQSVYELDGLLVTGLHRVYHDTQWITVAEHPESSQFYNYNESVVYCLNTNTKVIKINSFTFVDWDDLDNSEINQINNKCPFLPERLCNKNIHKYLDNGLDGNSLIELKIGIPSKIKDIEVNDILKFGERVLGIIKIDSKDIVSINEYKIEDTIIRCSTNIQMQHNVLGIINTSNLQGKSISVDNYLYQLVTDKGFFYIGNIKIYDYNIGLEKYLDYPEIFQTC